MDFKNGVISLNLIVNTFIFYYNGDHKENI